MSKKAGKISDKAVLAILAVVVLVLIIIVLVNVNKKDDIAGTGNEETTAPIVQSETTGPMVEGDENIEISGNVKTNVSEKLNSQKTFGVYTLTNIHLESVSGLSSLTATVTANVSEKVSGKSVNIEFYDKNGKLLETMGAYLPQIGPDETKLLRASSTTDLANVYDFKIVDAQ